jgi:uncharacterized protein YggE
MLKKFALACAVLIAPVAVASQLPDYPFIHVTGSAWTVAIPDIGELDFEIAAAGADPAAARAAVEARIAEVQALVEEQGLPADDVAVRAVRQDIRKNEGTPDAPVYEVRCAVHLNVRDLSKWPALAGGLLAKPNLDGFAAAFGRTDQDRVDDEVTADAIHDARRRAEALAAGFGRKLGPVTAVTPGALKNLSNAMGLVPADFYPRGGGKGPQVERADILSVTAVKLVRSVDVIFRIK